MSAVVEDKDDGRRLDRWIMDRAPSLSFGDVNRMIRTGQVRVDGKRAKANTRLEEGQTLRLPPSFDQGMKPRNDTELSDADRDFVASIIAFEDDDLIILNKPSGLPVQGGSKQTRHVDGLMRGYYAGKCEPKLAHRLDKDTSGLLALGKHTRAVARLSEAFRVDQVSKTYIALVEGKPERSGEVDLPLLKSRTGRGEAESMQVNMDEGQQAFTEYSRTEYFGGISLMDLKPITGRTHQLRVHMAALGHPILGDRKYGDGRSAPRLMLHARELELPDPATGRRIRFRADIPEAMQNFMDKVRG